MSGNGVYAEQNPAGQEYDDDDEIINQEVGEDEDEAPEPDQESADTEDEDYGDNAEMSEAARNDVARREKARLKELARQKKENLEKMREQQNKLAEADDAQRGRARLNFLLQQAEIFQHFAPVASNKEQKKKSKGAGRNTGKYTEEQEDSDLLKDEADDLGNQAHRLTVQPSCISFGTMREYQMQGLNWLIHLYDNGINGILADEMGLGKTLQTISLLGYLNEYRGITGPHLVLVPKSTLHNWLNEFRRWCPIIRAIKFHGNAEERERAKAVELVPGQFDVCITSFEMVIKEKNFFKKFHWRYVIIDEAHRIKNENSILSRVVRMMHTNYRLLITGTPLQNNLHELWALLNFLLPEVFSSSEKFDEWFSIGVGGEGEAEVVQQLHKVLRPFLLRRVKSDVERGLPPKKETILKIGMSAMQKKYYAALLQKDIEAVNGGAERSRLLNIVMQLRKCCNHPYLFQGAEPGPPFITGDHLVENSGKLVLLDKLLPKLKERDSRVLIFSQMTRMLDILEDYCLYKGYQYCRIDGNTAGDDRENAIDSFNQKDSEKFVFLLSTRAGGLGINLATADIVVLYDSDWNPQMDLQAMDRAHRIGQKKEVQVFRFCIANSVEEKVIEKAYKKLRLDALVIQQGRLTETKSSVNKDDLLSMVRYGAEQVFSSEAENITDADIDDILAKGEDETKAMNDKLAEFTDNARKFTLDGGMVYDFKDEEDKDTVDAPTLKAIMSSNWVDPPRRERKRIHNYSEQEYYRQTMSRGQGPKQGGPRLSKMPQLQDFQFYNISRLSEIYEKEHAYEIHKHQMAQKESAAKAQGASEDAVQAQLVPSPDDPQPLTEEEIAEREQLLSEGFSSWGRREFNAFVRACEKYGRHNLKDIASEIETKTEEEVRAYAKVFWKRTNELADEEKIIKTIERGEQRIQRQQNIMNAVAAKLERYKNPVLEMKIQYGTNKGKAYTEEEDRFILCTMHQLGYGAWDELKAEIHRSWRFRFDWFFKSRTPQELARRCDTLIRLVEKENEEMEAKEEEQQRKSGKSGSKAVSESSGQSGKRRNSSQGGGPEKRKK
uniref:SWI/SNF-related matrix-associated actin-dependent regulator of chromatin subfamily A member 5 n=1 Tax=Tetraselmis sp. GSL018 TaxID=582737 RepID=A0A061QM65_9CHLO|mmetsp:Transcript_32858/g.77903  ORF Transcript_32858/g.77903 Transcript_32858/m.77903 type:complete len:1062 (+) Transcript_32858:347-3532(+)|eukprot:CAMPEP_0177601948 /NCGR_PEP_ID=MMETSP0419_2-20121207/14576_1 /TAXON_ID=582737 /ORGANISM="Tetraselmis sp., Strain GSL018" /LENGTH=1061 /DNA_ID=CAMNT_0019095337 /DNA_START=474 /DNA_END=3659 /DNA_ORIENTATION=-